MKIVFTLCSNNYLSHAKVLGKSVLKFNPEVRFIIGLVDEFNNKINYNDFIGFEIIKYDEIGFPFFSEMISLYNVIEFNTSVKPFYFEFLLNRFGENTKILYLDPDIKVYYSLNELFDILETNSLVLTPNIINEPEYASNGELASLRHGMYNLGFLGLSHSNESMRFLKWWERRLRFYCIIDKCKGIFVDQKWIDLAPLFFNQIYLLKHPGYNMAWWNLEERKLICDEGLYFVNDKLNKLIFFHFSGFEPESKNFTGRNYNSTLYSFENHPELISIFNDYYNDLKECEYLTISNLDPLLKFGSSKNITQYKFKDRFKNIIKLILKWLWSKI